MHLNAAIEIYAGGKGSGCNPEVAVPRCGRPSSKGEGEGFVSPNLSENLSFEQAQAKLESPEQKQFLQHAQKVATTVDSGTVHSAIGDWHDGAENSTVLHARKVSDDQMRYMVALLGRDSSQKQVISFVHETGGPDTMYTFRASKDMQEVRSTLDNAGIQFRTLVPVKNGTEVYVFDPGSHLRDNIGKAAQHYGVKVQFATGHGDFIGGETREEGRSAYNKIIRSYEAIHGRPHF